MKKQTALDWLHEELCSGRELSTIIQQAKQIEKEYNQKLADDAFKLGWESHKTFTS